MSTELCTSCNELVDTDDDTECFIGDTCICSVCRELNANEVYMAELNRDMAKDRA